VTSASDSAPDNADSANGLRSAVPPWRPRRFARWLWQLTKDVVDEYRRDGAGDLAAAITFWTVLSIPAAVLALISGLSSLDSVVGSSVAADVRGWTRDFIAEQFVNSGALRSTVDELFANSNRGLVTVATAVAIFTLSRAFAGLIRALDDAYGVEEGRSWWHARLVAVGLGLGTLIVVASAATLLALLPSLPLGIAGRVLTVPLVFAALVLWAATIYHIGPNHRTPWRFDVPGAVVTAVGWVASTQLFAVYIRVSGSRNQVQSTVGAILLALTLMYVLSLVMIVGAELNEIIARRAGVVQQPRSVRALATRLREWYRPPRTGGDRGPTPD
jgi:membrane protein